MHVNEPALESGAHNTKQRHRRGGEAKNSGLERMTLADGHTSATGSVTSPAVPAGWKTDSRIYFACHHFRNTPTRRQR